MLIREAILENFMSYEYARIPLKPGVNVVCGPNGSGKSSMLLGISVALGQSYTERSKKLSDLIRWGKDIARVTLVLDNSRRKGRRSVPKIDKDYIFLTRVLRRDGKYWFELENRAADKSDVVRLLSKFEVDPDNMLIIMHQNMVEQFTVLSPQEKLRMVEAAVGLEPYRRNVLEAQRKLSRILSEEESVGKLLESAEQTLNYWREQYDRYQQKKQLTMKRRFLERELAWAEVWRREGMVSELREQIRKEQSEASRIENEIKAFNGQINELQGELEQLKLEWRKLFEERLMLEREKAKSESGVALAQKTLEEMGSWIEASRERMRECLGKIEVLEKALHESQNPSHLENQLMEIKMAYENFGGMWSQQLNLKSEDLKTLIENSNKRLATLDNDIKDVQGKIDHINFELEGVNNSLLDRKINLALLQYQRESLAKALEKLNKELETSLIDLKGFVKRAEETGPQIVPVKSISDILDEIRLTDGHLAALADISEDIERMYESYSKLYLELKEKARLVAENREKALEEVKARMESWRTILQNLLIHVSLQYLAILSEAQATGEVHLINEHDIEAAGLEILVGFRGAKPVPLDSYTQSGGERSTATMTFLLALQQHVRSPFRAIDEYDIHMDPKNREIIANLLVSSIKGLDAQYLAITPSQVTFMGKDVHIITVQNVEGTSLIKEVI
ncbi:MAG: Chromosome partition protein Smc [Candidatus Bathyarchaeota archaeon BA1]|nr:MAG: Chromosome partition protein Smc [Candidatus Bathyarchaeota archaeon BA1]